MRNLLFFYINLCFLLIGIENALFISSQQITMSVEYINRQEKKMVKKLLRFSLSIFVLLGVSLNTYAVPIWGSLDNTRMSRELQSDFSGFSSTIASSGSTITSSNLLTSSYLSSVDVFFYGWAGTAAGILSTGEQSVLQNFVLGGGTLIATADIFNIDAINSTTSMFGMTHTPVSNGGTYTAPVAPHAITQGISQIYYNTESTFTMPGNAQALFNNPDGNVFMAVMDQTTGFNDGRLLVMGDHNILADYAQNADNALLYQNIVSWANQPGTVPEPSVMALLFLGLFSMAAFRRKV